jgi:hypothetical protein
VITPPQDIKIEAMYSNQKEVPLTGGKSYTLDGSLALAYARNRKSTANGDFDRAQRQQEVIMAIRNRIIAYKSMPMLIAKSSEIYAELSDGIATNLSLEQLMQLGQLALQIDPQKIAKAVISPQDAPPTLANLPDGTSTAIDQPVPDRIRALRDKVFASSPTSAEVLVSNDTLILAKQEGARISLQNGSSSGSVSASTATYLGQQGLTISEQKAADHAYPSTTLVIYNSKPYTLKYLANLFQVPSNRILYRYDPASSVDIGLIIGEDWAKNNTLPK